VSIRGPALREIFFSPFTNHESPITNHQSPFTLFPAAIWVFHESPRVIDKPWHETMFVVVFFE
jgi:hypothetical protein